MSPRSSSHLAFLLVFVWLVWGCSASPTSTQGPYSSDALYRIGDVFADFYQRLGGEEFLGPCLTDTFEINGIYYQYTSSVLMVYDPNAQALKRYSLAPLADEMGIVEPPLPSEGGYELNGYQIWEEVFPIYERLGREIIGYPLTNTRYNAELRRYEQYFENMGFYRMEDDPTNSVHLLAYGAWKCGEYCSYMSTRDTVIQRTGPLSPSDTQLQSAEQAINEAAARIGSQLTGEAISPVYASADGHLEKIYENLVFAVDPADMGRAYVRPLNDALNIHPDPLEEQNPGMYFYPIEENLGYNVPIYFIDYITLHGGIEVSDLPITRQFAVNENVSRQCFANLCLEFHQTAPGSLRVRPQPIGYIYRDLNYRPSMAATSVPTLQSAGVKSWEEEPLLSSQQQQVIYAVVYDNNIAVSGIELRLILTLPDGSQETFSMSQTDEKGQSSINLPFIQGANGTLVPYQVCVVSASVSKLCDQQSFILWDNP